jgi:hypothetical protein
MVSEESTLIPNMDFAKLASDDQIKRTAEALEANNIHTIIAADGFQAKHVFFELVPEGASLLITTFFLD